MEEKKLDLVTFFRAMGYDTSLEVKEGDTENYYEFYAKRAKEMIYLKMPKSDYEKYIQITKQK